MVEHSGEPRVVQMADSMAFHWAAQTEADLVEPMALHWVEHLVGLWADSMVAQKE